MHAFNAAGHDAELVPSREALPPTEGIVFLAVPDGAVSETAARIARADSSEATSFVHCSGALGLAALAPLSDHPVGSFHPLQSFPAPRPPEAFQGITVAVDATSTALERRLAQLARDIGARARHVGDGERALYHAAAVFASNYVVVVVAEAVKALAAAGWAEKEAVQALIPLIRGVVDNIASAGPAAALTGPIKRGDVDTVMRHLQALKPLPGQPPLQAVYRMLGQVALELAKEEGLDPAAARRTNRALTQDVAATRRRSRR